MQQNNTLFDFLDEQNIPVDSSKKLNVVKMNFDTVELMDWRDLFAGFNKLRAITYSSGLNFVCQLVTLFADAEIIFGCEDVMSYTFQEIMAYQVKLIEKIRNKTSKTNMELLQRIDNKSVRLYVAREQLSHEKIYLLEADDGRKRVIMGSANMSFNAFGGKQRENICYVDGDSAYDWYSDVYNELKNNSTDNITKTAITVADADENLDELPIAAAAKAKKLIVLETDKTNSEDVKFVLDTRQLAKNLAPLSPVVDKKSGKILITPESIIKIRKRIIDNNLQEKELRSEYPQLVLDINAGTVKLNDIYLDLNPNKDAITADIELFLKYMEGYSKFHGDYIEMQRRYFEFANWFFSSPFMATMRDVATRNNHNKLPYPVFGLLYGQSKAGKTSFLETLLKMMIGQKPKVSAPDFTRVQIEDLKRKVKGAPIIVDDLTNSRFNAHAIETIKNDDFGLGEHLVDYPAVVISANEDVKVVAPEIVRRTVICRVSAGLTNTEVMKSNIVRTTQTKIGTAIYREYLRRMITIVPELIDKMKSDESESAPDILMYSSQILVDIFNEHCEQVPEYIRSLTLDDYFNEQVTAKYAIQTIRDAWQINRKAFKINVKKNQLRYNAGEVYEAARLKKELPETLETHRSREYIIMKLDEAKKFFNLDFKKTIFS